MSELSYHADEFIATASSIGMQICRDAIWSGERCNWIGASMMPVDGEWKTVQTTLGPELYGGTSGIALFLARLYSKTHERLHRATALAALNHANAHANRIPVSMQQSFYSGKVGIYYASIAVGEVLNDEKLVSSSLLKLNELLTSEIPESELDVVSGIAGAIPAILSIHRRYPNPELLRQAERLGEQLLSAAVPGDRGISWPNAAMSSKHNLTGLSHGTAGFAWSLLELYEVSGHNPLLATARGAFRYERGWFNTKEQNWPDLRDLGAFGYGSASTTPTETFGMAWCHGAPGIGLSRARALQLMPHDAELAGEVESAVASTERGVRWALSSPASSNFSLCHGVSGNSELLLNASRVKNSEPLRTSADHAGKVGIALYGSTSSAWPCGVNGGGQTPGLLLGTAGIGYFYLRLHDVDDTPSLLLVSADEDEHALSVLG